MAEHKLIYYDLMTLVSGLLYLHCSGFLLIEQHFCQEAERL